MLMGINEWFSDAGLLVEYNYCSLLLHSDIDNYTSLMRASFTGIVPMGAVHECMAIS